MIKECPRCGNHSLECLKTHSYCASCNYDSDGRWEAEKNNDSLLALLCELESAIEVQANHCGDDGSPFDGSEAA